jgi:hypothetical protein
MPGGAVKLPQRPGVKHRILFECVQDFLATHVITAAGAFKGDGFTTLGAFYQEVLLAWCVNLLVACLIPESRMAERLCRLFGVQEKPAPRYLLTLAVIVCINVTCIFACVLLWKVGPTSLYPVMFGKLYPALLLAGYIGGCLLFPVTTKFVKWITAF